VQPSKKVFDLILITALLLHPAVGLAKMAARRWSAEGNGALATVGRAVEVSL
jgi:hypothetical protein